MKRIVPGLLIAGFWLLLIVKGPAAVFCLVVIGVALIAADEYEKMADRRDIIALERWLLNAFITLPILVVCLNPGRSIPAFGVVVSLFCLTCYCLYRYKEAEGIYNLFCRLVFGSVYIGLLGAHVVLLRFLPEGGSWLIIASAVTACSDSGAYFVGRRWGKKKLCPVISPNKTREGAVGGIVAGILAAVIAAYLLLPEINWLFVVCVAVVLSVAGIVGDLTESVIKRGTGTKDSGNILAGHGGILDRVDSLLFACPVLYYLLAFPVSQ
ncbi:MAG: phosphatidate cytidylyltransferase [Desulforhopalus sp.]